MAERFKKHQQIYLVVVMVLCIGAVLVGGLYYVRSLQNNLVRQSVQTVLTVTVQQQQAFDNFISEDRQRLHSYARYFAQNRSDDVEDIRQKLTLFSEVDAFYTIINLETGYFCGNKSDDGFRWEAFRG